MKHSFYEEWPGWNVGERDRQGKRRQEWRESRQLGKRKKYGGGEQRKRDRCMERERVMRERERER